MSTFEQIEQEQLRSASHHKKDKDSSPVQHAQFTFRSDKSIYWLNKFSEVSNLHGMKWHQKVKKFSLKIFWIGYILAVVVAFPTFLTYKTYMFFMQVNNVNY